MTNRYLKMLFGQLKIETKLFLRDRSSVFWTYFFPVLLILMFGFIFNEPDVIRLEVAFVDNDRTDSSRELMLELLKMPVLSVSPMEEKEMRTSMESSKFPIAIVVPYGYDKALKNGESTQIDAYFNPEQQQFMQLILPILKEFVNDIAWQKLDREPPIQIVAEPFQALKEDFSYISFLIPGLIGFSLMATCLFSVGVVVVSYREKGKLRRLAVTPLPKPIFIAGQILTRYFVVLLQALLLLVIAVLLFDVKSNGNMLHFFIALSIGMLAFIALGYAIASVAKTPETASGIANSLFLPMTFLSGVYFSPEGLPDYLQPLVAILPLTHLVSAIRGIFSQGLLLWDFLPQMGILAMWAIVCFVFSIKKFKWE